MHPLRATLYVLGATLVVVGAFMLFFETGLAEWVPPGIAIAGLVILVGLFVMGLSESAHDDREHHGEHGDVRHTEYHRHENK